MLRFLKFAVAVIAFVLCAAIAFLPCIGTVLLAKFVSIWFFFLLILTFPTTIWLLAKFALLAADGPFGWINDWIEDIFD